MMSTNDPITLLPALLQTFRYHKQLGDRALERLSDAQFLTPLPGELDPIAIKVKHVGGNLRSRWRDFLTADGEKPDRHRDREFELAPEDDRASITALWERGWGALLETLEGLGTADLGATVHIRGEPHTVPQAAVRSLAHTAYHVGQIVQLARRAVGDDWESLSIPRGGSEAARRRGGDYLEPR